MDDSAPPPRHAADVEVADPPAESRGSVVRPAWVRLRRLRFWRSPAGQPLWARPALVAIAAVGAWSYAWRAAGAVNIEIYYAAAVRSMSMNFRNFVFGAFDPDGTVTTDKLPGAFWLQAISVRLLGVHNWALVLPQVIEGAVTILVLYHLVRRMAGPAAGILAAGILAISPATVALNRGNISDTLMILLAVLAADATVTAVLTGRRRVIIVAGVLVGLAFQAKMIEAWLVLPAIAACYLLAAPGGWAERIRRTCAMGAVAVAAICGLAAAWLRWPNLRLASITLSGLAVLAVPLVASVSVVTSGLGPFETPFESQRTTAEATAFFGAGFQAAQILPGLEAANRGTPFLMATQTAVLASPFIYASGREVLPIGGFTGTIPEPTLADLKFQIEINDVHLFVQAPRTNDPRLIWIARHCLKVTKRTGPPAILPLSVYYCPSLIFLPKSFP